jgi:hypothetical protein
MINGAAVGLTLMAICADPDEAHQCWRNLGPLRDEDVRTIVVMAGKHSARVLSVRVGDGGWRGRVGPGVIVLGGVFPILLTPI